MHDKEKRVVDGIYLMSIAIKVIDIVRIWPGCIRKWINISRTFRSIFCALNIQFFSTSETAALRSIICFFEELVLQIPVCYT
jgi:hypothetical protein